MSRRRQSSPSPYLPSSARAPICACRRMVTPPTRLDFASTHFLIGELGFVLFLLVVVQRFFFGSIPHPHGLKRAYKLFSAQVTTRQKLIGATNEFAFCFQQMKMNAVGSRPRRRKEFRPFWDSSAIFVSGLVSGINGVVIIHQGSSSLSSDCHSLLFFVLHSERGRKSC
jgi:hypothetical protein